MNITKAIQAIRTPRVFPWEMSLPTRVAWRLAPGVMRPLERGLAAVNPTFRHRRKNYWENGYWRQTQRELHQWFVDGTLPVWFGVPQPTAAQRVTTSPSWLANAILTLHQMRPMYWESLRIPGDHFAGQRILEIGCGALVPSLVFAARERHGIDPLVDAYKSLGYPLDEFPITLVNCGAERMPYADGFFDSVLSVNVLDHVDDFEQTAAEIARVTKRGGGLYIEVEYHQPTDTEPLVLSDERVVQAFRAFTMTPIVKRTGREMFEAIVQRFGLQPSTDTLGKFGDAKFVTWHGVKR